MAKNRKRKVSFGKVLFIVLISAMLLVLCYFGLVFIKDKFSSKPVNNNTPVETNPNSTEVNGKVDSMSLVSYEVFKDEADELGFNFVIAKVKFTTSSDSVYVNLADMQTSEKKYCDQLEYYYSKLEQFDYDLSNYNLAKSFVKANSDEVTVDLLIPYDSAKGELKVYCNSDVLKFDLTKTSPAESLIKNNIPQDQIVNDNETKKSLAVSKAYISDLMFKGDEPLPYPSSSYIYTFNLRVNEIENGVSIKDARFVKKGSTYEYEPLDKDISSAEIDNIIGKTLKVGDVYALFFNIFQNGDEPINYEGTLKLQFTDSDKWLEISTEIK